MDRTYRDEQLKRVNQKLLAGSALLDGLAREYTLSEIAIVTRAGPARLLGLKSKGHLGAGADADVTIYKDHPDRAQMFATPRHVIKGGTIVVEEGQLRRAPPGRRLAVRPEYDAAVTKDLKRFFQDYACVDGLPDVPDRLAVGKALRVFGDGFQASKVIGGKRYWRLPVMEGEFLVEETFGMQKGVGGGNFLILAGDADAALAAAEAAVLAMTNLPGVILPFPGGVVRSGSKVGSKRYRNMIATTNDAFDPTLRAITESQVPAGVNSVLEIVLDGTDAPAIEAAMRAGIRAACRPGVQGITAGNYGGKLGPHHFHLRKIMA